MRLNENKTTDINRGTLLSTHHAVFFRGMAHRNVLLFYSQTK